MSQMALMLGCDWSNRKPIARHCYAWLIGVAQSIGINHAKKPISAASQMTAVSTTSKQSGNKMDIESLDSLIRRFRNSAIMQINAVSKNPKEANRHFDILQAVFEEVQERGAEAMSAFSRLMDDPEPAVRLWAASKYLRIDGSTAEEVLEALSDSPNVFIKMSATMTLGYWKDPNFMPSF